MDTEGFSDGASGKEPTTQCRNMRDSGSIYELGTFPGGRHGNPLQYFCLKDPMDSMAAWVFMGSMLHPICHRPF